METPRDPTASREAHREARLARIERMTELPLMLLAFAMVPLLTASFFWSVSPSTEAVLVALDVLIWALFAVDLITKTAIAPHRAAYLRRHWLDVVIVLIPLARPLRLLRVVAYGARAYRGAMQLVRIDFLVTYAIGLILLIATVVTTVERGHNPKLDSFPDALWWSIVTRHHRGVRRHRAGDGDRQSPRLRPHDRRDRALRRSHRQLRVDADAPGRCRIDRDHRAGRGGPGHARGARAPERRAGRGLTGRTLPHTEVGSRREE